MATQSVRIGWRPYVNLATATYLLDTYSGATTAYSLRRLKSNYTGSAIRVRRSSDNTEQNIGFTSTGGLDTVSLLSFVGLGNGFVTIWYDQTGNGYNMVQTTAANQPQIVASGSVILQGSKPSMQWDGINDNLSCTLTGKSIYGQNMALISVSAPYSSFSLVNNYGRYANVFFPETGSWGEVYHVISKPNSISSLDGKISYRFGTGTSGNVPSYESLQFSNIILGTYKKGSVEVARTNGFDRVSLSDRALTVIATSNTINAGLGEYSTYYYGKQCEIIFYLSDMIDNRVLIERNINSYYSFYTPMITDSLAINLDAGNTLSYSGTGTSWVDLTGNSRNGTLVNGVGYSSNNGGYLTFDGTNDYVSVANTQACLGLKTNFTIEIWTKLTDTNRFNTLFSYGNNDNYSNDIIFFVNGNQICVQVNNGVDGGANTSFTSTGWNQLTMVFDGTLTGNSNRLKIYVNGVQQTLDFGSYNVPTNNGQNSTSAAIGAYSTGGFNNNYLGSIAINRLYTKSLSQSEISQNYAVTKSRFGL